MVYHLGKVLQLIGMANLLVGLYVGLTEEGGMWPELYLFLIGSLLFMIGRLLERRG